MITPTLAFIEFCSVWLQFIIAYLMHKQNMLLHMSYLISWALFPVFSSSSPFFFKCIFQNVDDKSSRDPSLEAPRRGAEVKDDDPIIPFGPQPTVSRFGAISRTSKSGYQTTCPVQAMATTLQNPNSKHMAMSGKNPCLPISSSIRPRGGVCPQQDTSPL